MGKGVKRTCDLDANITRLQGWKTMTNLQTQKATLREVERVVRGAPFHWVGDGFRVTNYFPGDRELARRVSPFFLLDYGPPRELAPSPTPRGVGPHPHRGFETVTLAFAGSVAHHDSAGNSGVIGPGDVQWMTAGSGILHKEYTEQSFSERGGEMHMLQLWVNLPAKYKMTPPKYQGLTHDQMGRVSLPGGEVRVVAGEYRATKGPASTHTPINMWVVNLEAGATFEAELNSKHNTGILMTRGRVSVGESTNAEHLDYVLFKNQPGSIRVVAKDAASFVLLSGEPIDEPVAHYGPFVMNTRAELEQAIHDFNAGKFGELED